MICGVLFYSYTISTLTNLLNQLDRRNIQITKKLEILNAICKEYSINLSLKKKLIQAVKYEEMKNKSEKIEFVNSLPPNLKISLSIKMNEALIKKNQFFSTKPAQFIAYVSPFLKPIRVSKGEFIYKEGDHADEFYFVVKGQVQYVVEIEEEILEYYETNEGEHFGETELIIEVVEGIQKTRDNTARASMHSEFLGFRKEDFIECFQKFQGYFDDMYENSLQKHSEYQRLRDQAIIKLVRNKIDQDFRNFSEINLKDESNKTSTPLPNSTNQSNSASPFQDQKRKKSLVIDTNSGDSKRFRKEGIAQSGLSTARESEEESLKGSITKLNQNHNEEQENTTSSHNINRTDSMILRQFQRPRVKKKTFVPCKPQGFQRTNKRKSSLGQSPQSQ